LGDWEGEGGGREKPRARAQRRKMEKRQFAENSMEPRTDRWEPMFIPREDSTSGEGEAMAAGSAGYSGRSGLTHHDESIRLIEWLNVYK
jgi:hypothetical protein